MNNQKEDKYHCDEKMQQTAFEQNGHKYVVYTCIECGYKEEIRPKAPKNEKPPPNQS